MASSSHPQKSKRLIPSWAQASIAVDVIIIIIVISSRSLIFSSEWYKVNSSFFDDATQALKYSNVNIYQGPTPTLVLFWEHSCEACKANIQYLRQMNPKFFIVGVHLKADIKTKTKAKQWWVQNAPRQASVYFDDIQMLEKTFKIKVVPHSFLVYPLKKEMLGLAGSFKRSRPSLESFNQSR